MRRKRIGVVGNAPGGNYRAMLLELLAETAISPGSVGSVTVAHDDGCGIFDGRPCECDPDVRMVWRDGGRDEATNR